MTDRLSLLRAKYARELTPLSRLDRLRARYANLEATTEPEQPTIPSIMAKSQEGPSASGPNLLGRSLEVVPSEYPPTPVPSPLESRGVRADATRVAPAVYEEPAPPEPIQVPVMRARTELPRQNALQSFINTLADRITFGATTRAAAAWRADKREVPFGEVYDEELARLKAIQGQAKQDNPVASALGTIGGDAALSAAGVRGIEAVAKPTSAIGRLLFPGADATFGRRVLSNYLGGGTGPLLDAYDASRQDGNEVQAFLLNSLFSGAGAGVVEGGIRGYKALTANPGAAAVDIAASQPPIRSRPLPILEPEPVRPTVTEPEITAPAAPTVSTVADDATEAATEAADSDVMFPGVPPITPARVTKAGRVMSYQGGNAKFRTWGLDKLESYRLELVERFEKANKVWQDGTTPWTREDDDIGMVRSGTAVSGAAGRAIASMNQTERMLRLVDRELVGRYNALTPDEIAGRETFAFENLGPLLEDNSLLRAWEDAAAEAGAGTDFNFLTDRSGRIGGLRHGSHADFPQFSDDAVGSGEGAQVYSWGHYATDSRGIAENYREALVAKHLGPPKAVIDGKKVGSYWELWDSVSEEERDALRAALDVDPQLERADPDEWVKSLVSVAGSLSHDFDRPDLVEPIMRVVNRIEVDDSRRGYVYKLEFDADDEELIHWDLPLWKQPDKVKSALRQHPLIDEALLDWESPRHIASELAAKTSNGDPMMFAAERKKIQRLIEDYHDTSTQLAELQLARDTDPDTLEYIAKLTRESDDIEQQILKEVGPWAGYEDVLDRIRRSSVTAYSHSIDETVDRAGDWLIQIGATSRAQGIRPADMTARDVAKDLLGRGVKGVKYANGPTRGLRPNDQRFNYVAFDANLFKILERGALGDAQGDGAGRMLGGILGSTGGAATGAAVGASQGDTPEERQRLAAAGALAGLAGGMGAGFKLGDVADRFIASRASAPISRALARDARRGALGSTGGTSPTGGAAPSATPATDRIEGMKPWNRPVTLHTFTKDATGKERLAEAVVDIIDSGDAAKLRQPVTHDEIRATAQEIGLDAANLKPSDARRLNGAEMLAIKNLVTTNLEKMQEWVKRVEQIHVDAKGAPLTKAQQEEVVTLERLINGADTQNDALLHRFIKARGQTGRDLNNLRILANRVDEPMFWLGKARALMSDKAWEQRGDEVRRTIVSLLASGDTEALVQYISKQRTSTLGEKVQAFWKANLLTNPLTHSVNLTSNSAMLALEELKNNPAAAADWLMGLATGGRTVSATSARAMVESVKGAREGLLDAKRVIQGGLGQDALQKYDIPRRVNYDNKIIDTYVNTVFNLLGAEDRVFRAMAYRGSIANQAKVLAKGDAKMVERLIADPTDEMAMRALADAEEATFQDKTMVGHLLSTVGNAKILGTNFAPFGFFIPFTKTPGAVATRIFEYSPGGALVGTGQIGAVVLKALRGGKVNAATQREAARLFGRGVTGTGLVGLGYWLASKGLMAGSTDKNDRVQRDTNMLTGAVDGGVRIGDTNVDFTRIAPIGHLLLLGANLHGAVKEGGSSPLGLAGAGASSLARSVLDQPFLSGIEAGLQAKDDPQGKVARRLGWNIAGGFVPFSSGLAAVARATDPVYRQPENLGEFAQSRLPFLSDDTPPSLDQFGKPAKREEGGRGWLNALVNPARATTYRAASDPVLGEIERLGSTISRRTARNGATEAQVRALVADEGPVIRQALEQLMANPEYRSADDWQKAYAIDQTINRIRSNFGRKHNIAPSRIELLREKYGVK